MRFELSMICGKGKWHISGCRLEGKNFAPTCIHGTDLSGLFSKKRDGIIYDSDEDYFFDYIQMIELYHPFSECSDICYICYRTMKSTMDLQKKYGRAKQ